MVDVDFLAWLANFSMTVVIASQVFGVSTRTIYRWGETKRIPATAFRICQSIENAAPPWSQSFHRGTRAGVQAMSLSWRREIFGDDWAAAAEAADKAQRERQAIVAARERAAMRAREAEIRKERALRAAATRRKIALRKGGALRSQ